MSIILVRLCFDLFLEQHFVYYLCPDRLRLKIAVKLEYGNVMQFLIFCILDGFFFSLKNIKNVLFNE